ncbi:MAG: hypothetical protein HFF62_10610 [Oscillospiraceae bacterium]|jgi:hypothetical protein|nr:hypothetical protein [Oscillospiraceae bacterium]
MCKKVMACVLLFLMLAVFTAAGNVRSAVPEAQYTEDDSQSAYVDSSPNHETVRHVKSPVYPSSAEAPAARKNTDKLVGYLSAATILALGMLMIAKPRLFWKIEHIFSVKGGEPTAFYIAFTQFCGASFIVVTVIVLLAALLQ